MVFAASKDRLVASWSINEWSLLLSIMSDNSICCLYYSVYGVPNEFDTAHQSSAKTKLDSVK